MALNSPQLERIDVASWPNDYHIRNYKTQLGLLNSEFDVDNPAPAMLAPLITAFSGKLTAEDAIVDKITKMPQTELIAKADGERDSMEKQMKDVVKINLTADFFPEKKAAAQVLWPLIDHYKLDPQMELEKQTENLQQWYQDYSADPAQATAAETLGLTALIAALMAKNTEVDTLIRQREAARAAQAGQNVSVARKETDQAFQNLCTMLNALAIADPDADRFTSVITGMNQEQRRMRDIVEDQRRMNRRVAVKSKAIGNHTYAVSSGWTWERLCEEPKVLLAVFGNRIVSTDKKAGKLIYYLALKGLAVLPEAEVDATKNYELVLDGPIPVPTPGRGGENEQGGGGSDDGGSDEGGSSDVTPVQPE